MSLGHLHPVFVQVNIERIAVLDIMVLRSERLSNLVLLSIISGVFLSFDKHIGYLRIVKCYRHSDIWLPNCVSRNVLFSSFNYKIEMRKLQRTLKLRLCLN